MGKLKTIHVECPKCGAGWNHLCRRVRIPSYNTLDGSWGGPGYLQRSHPERVAARKSREVALVRSYLAARKSREVTNG